MKKQRQYRITVIKIVIDCKRGIDVTFFRRSDTLPQKDTKQYHPSQTSLERLTEAISLASIHRVSPHMHNPTRFYQFIYINPRS
jgi:hypothetical protein